MANHIPTIEELLGQEVETFDDSPLPTGPYNAVITGCAVKAGQKSKIPYLSPECTVFDGQHQRRKVWGMSSFSEKATTMPGGIANLMQSTQPEFPTDVPQEQIPAVIAAAILGSPVTITVEHEQVERDGVKQTNDDGTPEMRAKVRKYDGPSEEFLAAFASAVGDGDDDLPF